ncbi:MAG TPA: arabinofuranosidase catalytic domain-containing protein [Polyangia bacterium]|nr:arabinofuranosidase catalytic domain-containing protein [Polyangia bacterium]
MGYSSVNCTTAAGGGCNCSATVNQAGGIGVVSASASMSGNFTTSGNTLTTDSSTPYSYCASGGKLTLTPEAPTTGTVVLQGAGTGTTGSGGATGGAGAGGGRGGSTGAGGGAGGAGGAAGAGGAGTAGSTGAGGSPVTFQGPCDIYAAGATPTPCVAAYSTTRLLSSKYSGPLYQVRMGGSNLGTGGTLKDIGLIAGGVFADGPAQDAFCGTSACTISKLYDQSGKGNDLTVEGAGCYVTTPDNEANAKGHSLTASGHKVYALYSVSVSNGEHDGYRNDTATGLPLGTAAQGVYEVVDGTRSNTGCCWDFGSARRDNCYYDGTGTMDTIFFGKSFWMTGAGNGPWFMADFEGGVWTGGSAKTAAGQNTTDPSVTWDYAFGVVKTNTVNNTPQWAMRVGDGQSGGLTTAYDGQAPATWNLQGAVVLGTGGDNSNGSFGTFFEGAITAGRPSDATDLAVQQNVQAAGYGK